MSLTKLIFILLTLFCVSCTPHSKREINKLESLGDIENLIDIASKGGKSERVNAIRALGVLKDPRAIRALSAAMSSASSWVEREAIVVSLGKINDYMSLPPLIKALKDKNQFVRERAASELVSVSRSVGKRKNTRIISMLIDGINESNTFARTQAETAFQAAIDQLKVIRKPKYFQQLVDMLNNHNRYQRRQAAIAFGKLNDERAIPHLIEAQTNRDHMLREIAGKSLKLINSPRSLKQFIKSLRSDDKSTRDKAVAAMSGIKGRREIIKLENYLRDKEPSVKAGVIRVLEKVGNKSSLKKIARLLNDPDTQVRLQASETLARSGWIPANDSEQVQFCIAAQNWFDCRTAGKRVIPALVLRLEDTSVEIRKYAASVLSSLDWQPSGDHELMLQSVASRDWEASVRYGEKALDALIRELDNPDNGVVKAVIKTLVTIRHNRAMQPLIHLFNKSDVEIRIILVEALGEFNHPLAMKTLVRILEDKSEAVRQAAASALDNNIKLFKKKEYFDLTTPLVATLKDNNHHVRVIATNLLGELQDPGTIGDLVVAMGDTHRRVRETAFEAIRQFRETSAIEPLVKGLKSDKPEVRKRLIEVLAQFRDYRALEPLPALLKDRDTGVVLQTIKVLGAMSDPGTVAPLLGMLDSGNPDYVVRAIESLDDKQDADILPALYKVSHHRKAMIRNRAGKALLKHNWEPATEKEQGKYCVIQRDWLSCEKIGSPAVDALLLELEDAGSDSRIESARILGHIRDLRAIRPLLTSLLDNSWTDDEHRAGRFVQSVLIALEKFGKSALPELTGHLNNWYLNRYVARILGSAGWLPGNDALLVHYRIAQRSSDALMADWKLTLQVLKNDIKSGEAMAINNALFTLIGLGQKEGLDILLETLIDKGSVDLAEAFLNSENETLHEAAINWTGDQDLEIKEFSAGNTPVIWGRIEMPKMREISENLQ